MGFLDVLGSAFATLTAVAVLILQGWLITTTLRRVLGVRVGWPRTFVVSAATVLGLMALVQWLVTQGHLSATGNPLSVMAYLGLIVLWSFAVASAIVVGLEMIIPTGSLPPLRHLFLGWRQRWRRGRRYSQILAIGAKHGVGAPMRGLLSPRRAEDRRTAESLKLALEEAGVTFIKLGQMLSTRADLLPPVYIRELNQLHNEAAPEPWTAIRTELEKELGCPLDEVFATIDETPLASASVAQVHHATLLDGADVVVKVQRPGAAEQAELDLEILRRLASTWHRNSPEARRLGLSDLIDGFADSLIDELDYRVEADNMRALRDSLARHEVGVPEVYENLSGRRLLIMERFDGTAVSQSADLLQGLSDEARREMAARLLSAVLAQILHDGLFHADLHPGNVIVWADGRVGLLDFGSVGRLDTATRRALTLLLWAFDADDQALATDSLLELLGRPETVDENSLQRSIGGLMMRFRSQSNASLAVFADMFTIVIEQGFSVPAQLATALRSLGALEGTLKLIDPGFDLATSVRTVGQDMFGAPSLETIKDEVLRRAVGLLPLLDRLPRQLSKITDDLGQGRLTIHIRALAHPSDRRFVNGLVQQLVVAVLTAAAILGGIILFIAPGGPQVLPGLSWYAFLGALLVFAGFMLSLRAVAMVFGRSSGEDAKR